MQIDDRETPEQLAALARLDASLAPGPVPEPLALLKVDPLVVADRCDRCGAQALVRYVSRLGELLDFCGHHNTAYGAGLRSQGFEVAHTAEVSA